MLKALISLSHHYQLKMKNNHSIAWIDLDDTLWDFHANSRVSLRGLYTDYHLDSHYPTVNDWINCYERHNHALWNQYNLGEIEKNYLMTERFLRPLVEVGHPDAVRLASKFDTEYLDRLARCTLLIDGAFDLLRDLRANGWETGILSNGFVEVQHCKINNSGLAPYIDHIILSDDIGINKPDVRLYRHAERQAGVEASDCLMIGDNLATDIAGAIAAGWKAIYFTRDETAESPDVPTIHRLCDALPLIVSCKG